MRKTFNQCICVLTLLKRLFPTSQSLPISTQSTSDDTKISTFVQKQIMGMHLFISSPGWAQKIRPGEGL
jgi:hypothetical protein